MEVLGFPGQALGLQSLTSVTNGMTINLRRNEEATGQNALSPPPPTSLYVEEPFCGSLVTP